MTEDHKPLPVHGYAPQSDAKVALVNSFKEDEERLLRKLDELGQPVATDGMSRPIGPGEWRDVQYIEVDKRWVAIARTHFQEGWMALNRAVFQPRRVKLPEDDPEYKMTAHGRRPDGTIGEMTSEEYKAATDNPPGRQTSPEIASLAGKYLNFELGLYPPGEALEVQADIRKLAASALGQVNE